MLTIRDYQMGIFGALEVERFEDRVLLHLAHQHPMEFARLGDEGTRALIRRAVAKGKQHGIVLEGAVLLLADLMVEFGEKFERSPQGKRAMTLLEHPTLPGPVKMEGVRDRLRASIGGMKMVVYR